MSLQDVVSVFVIIFIECALSLDNALALAILVKPLPEGKQQKALLAGVWSAFGFRALALLFVSHLLKAYWIKFVGAGYLLYWAYTNLFKKEEEEKKLPDSTDWSFWKTVLMVELLDIAFSVDNILAAAGLSKNIAIVVFGGMVGIFTMRYAANGFVRLMKRFPALEHSAFLLVAAIGIKLFLEGFYINFDSPKEFAFWAFWLTVASIISFGFVKTPQTTRAAA